MKLFPKFINVVDRYSGDIKGATAATIITLPVSIGYGTIAFSSLGSGLSSQAVLSGIYAAVFCGLLAALFGGTATQITTPKASLTLLLAAFVTDISLHIPSHLESRIELIIALAASVILIAGMFQILLGTLKIGNVVKYVPSSVVAGFVNGIALLLIIKQLNPLMGIEIDYPIFGIFANPDLIQETTLIVGVLTIATYYISRKYIKFLPAPLVALVAGTIIHNALGYLFGDLSFGPLIGTFEGTIPNPTALKGLFADNSGVNFTGIFLEIFIAGMLIGMLSSMESLLCSVVNDGLSSKRHNSNQELIGQGIGNISSAIFGGLAGAGSVQSSVTSYNAGGRTRSAGVLSSIFILLVVVLFDSLISIIPLSVIAGIIISVELTMFDKWTIGYLTRLKRFRSLRKDVVLNFIVIVTVTILTLVINLVWAVLIGMIMASVLFISSISNSAIRRSYTAGKVRSRKMRELDQQKILESEGEKIHVFELQGPLFFGSADNLYIEIEKHIDKSDIFILDFKRVSQIDSKGANILIQISNMLRNSKKSLYISHVSFNSPLWIFMDEMEVFKSIDKETFFFDTDIALENAEEILLNQRMIQKAFTEVPFSEMSIAENFSDDELKIFENLFVKETYETGQKIIEEGEEDKDIFILLKGSVSVKILLSGKDNYKRVSTYSEGVLFGEIAMLDGKPRTADVIADRKSEIYRLPYNQFELLCKNHPAIAIKLLTKIGSELSSRLRSVMNELRELEDD